MKEKIKDVIHEYVIKMWFTDEPITKFENSCSGICGLDKNYKNANEDLKYLTENIPNEKLITIDNIWLLLKEKYEGFK